MSDEALQAARRRWRSTGAVADEARWLLERVRAGELGRERVALAALLGHAGAGAALDRGDRGAGAFKEVRDALLRAAADVKQRATLVVFRALFAELAPSAPIEAALDRAAESWPRLRPEEVATLDAHASGQHARSRRAWLLLRSVVDDELDRSLEQALDQAVQALGKDGAAALLGAGLGAWLVE